MNGGADQADIFDGGSDLKSRPSAVDLFVLSGGKRFGTFNVHFWAVRPIPHLAKYVAKLLPAKSGG